MNPPSICWFRLDLRLADNPALQAAIRRGGAVVPVFIWAPEEEGDWLPGAASRWWLHQSLGALDTRLRKIGFRLVVRRGPAMEVLRRLARETSAGAVLWNRRYEPVIRDRDGMVERALRAEGLQTESFNAALLHEPWTIRNATGKPFQVFTPFWRSCLAHPDPAEPLPSPRRLTSPPKWPKSLPISDLELEPRINWAEGLADAWQPGETGAHANLRRFLASAFTDYDEERNRPDVPGTSRLSPHLHFGEISPRQIWPGLTGVAAKRGLLRVQWHRSQFLAELGWREFSHHLLYHFPRTPAEPLCPVFRKFPWRKTSALHKAWQKGCTGYPIVDAGMRELWATGWMHNRVRMIVASFLVKDLLISWQEGARWFWDTLVDADLAQNTLGWQWVAGCGADAAPYFRIFNPVTRGGKCDPGGDYVRRWCPELVRLPAEWIHQPHKAPLDVLRAAKVQLGRNHPNPIVNHTIAREVALDAYERIKTA